MKHPASPTADLSIAEKRELLGQLLQKKLSEPKTAPASFAQQRLWFLDQYDPGTTFYNMPAALQLTGPLDTAALQRSLNEIVRRHASLRTTFAAPDGQPIQRIAPALTLPLPQINLQGLPANAQLAEVHRHASAEAEYSFDLANGPLLRALLLRLSEQEHVFLLTMHHIISDGWSMQVFVRELAALYAAFIAGQPSPLPELPIQYADFARWQRQWLQSAGEQELSPLQQQLNYWVAQLADAPKLLTLPTDRPRSPVQTVRGAVHTFTLPQTLTKELKALSQREGATLFMTLLAAFNILLSRYSGQDDILVGSSIANRTRVELEGLIGFFVNLLVLRTDLSGNPSFRDLLARTRKVTLGAYDHQDLPFERLVEEIQPERNLGYSPLCQVFFALQNTPPPALELAGLTLRRLEIERVTAKYDLYLSMAETENTLTGELEYNVDLFDSATIARMADHLQTLLQGIVAQPEAPIAALPLLSAAEQQQILVDWNATQMAYPDQDTLATLFEAQAARTPTAIAVIDGQRRLTYHELNARANQLARHLQQQGVEPEVLVGVSMERSADLVVALLAILKAGGAYVPLDPAYPPAHLAFMLEDTQLRVLIAEQRFDEALPEHKAQVVRLDADRETIARYSDTNPSSAVTPDHLLFVMYTSGSTGQPKGVMVTQRQLLSRFAWMWQTYPFAPGEVACQRTTVNFTVSLWELLGPLLQGVPTAIIPNDVVKDAELFIRALSDYGVTRIVVVPSLLEALLDSGIDLRQRLPRVKLWSVCGEAFTRELCQRFYERLPEATLLNQYGASEVNDAAWYDTRLGRHDLARVPIGRPIGNTQIYLLDDQLRPVPIGVPGEVYIGNAALARGYLNRPDLSAERFIPNPFADDLGTGDLGLGARDQERPPKPLAPNPKPHGLRLYRTGDLARYLPDGTLDYLGRRDHQIKIRGIRVELGGVEAILRRHPDVAQAAVVMREDTPGNKRMVAYVAPAPARAPTIAGHERYRLPNNLAIVHLNKNETDFLYSELFEGLTYLKHGITFGDGDCIFDVGANIGLFALFAHQHSPNATIFAFEPNPTALEALRLNMGLYGVQARLFECGLASAATTATFTFYPKFTFMSGIYGDAEEEKAIVRSFIRNQQHKSGGETESLDGDSERVLEELLEDRFTSQTFSVELRTMSEIMREHNVDHIDLLKVNVEKAEYDVLAGIEEEDWSKIKQVVMQVHDIDGRLDQVTALLRRHGYHLTVVQDWAIEQTQNVHYIYAVRTAPAGAPAPMPRVGTAAPVLHNPILAAGELRQFLQERLPEQMVPSDFVIVEHLPLTPNGKVNRRQLATWSQSRSDRHRAFVAPRTDIEQTLAGIAQDILAIERIGIHDNFFELGGHSLLATQVVSRVRTTLGVEVPVRMLFEQPTIASFAETIERIQAEQDAETLELLNMVEQLSPDEVAAEIQRRGLSNQVQR